MRIQNPTDIEAYLYTKGAKNKQYDADLDGKIDVLGVFGVEAPCWQEQTKQSTYDGIYNGHYTRWAQKVTINDKIVDGLAFYLAKSGSPTGSVYFRIRRVSDDSILAEVNVGDAADLPSNLSWIEGYFDEPIYLDEEVRLCVEFYGGDSSNYIKVGVNLPGSEVPGEMASYYDTAWHDYGTYDLTYKYHCLGRVRKAKVV